MVSPFTVGAGSAKVSGYPAALWEGTGTRLPTTSVARTNQCSPPTLDEQGVGVRWSMTPDLLCSNAAPKELDITPWKGNQGPLLPIVTVRGELLSTAKNDRILPLWGGSEGGVVQNKSPVRCVSVYPPLTSYTDCCLSMKEGKKKNKKKKGR